MSEKEESGDWRYIHAMPQSVDRRNFLRVLTGSSLALGLGSFGGVASLAGCRQGPVEGRYTQADIDALAQQKVTEAARSGQGPYGIQRFRGYRGLAELPWFELDESGTLRCVDESFPRAIDMHSHLGMSVLFEPELDLHATPPRVRHLLDCDATNPGCDLDLDVYINGNFTEQDLKGLEVQTITQGLWGNDFSRSQTIPALLGEMDTMRVEQAVVLPIVLNLPFGDNLTETWKQAIEAAEVSDRLIPGISVHPRDPNRLNQLEALAKAGGRILKLHPTVQGFYPDDPDIMETYALAEKLGLIIFFHGGRAGIEPSSQQPFAMPRHYEAAFSNFPKLPFIIGHAGARDGAAMLEIGRRYENVWFGIHGQSVTHLDEMIRKTDAERMLFGTDWPFYHLGASLAKVLLVTEEAGRRPLRNTILRENAMRLLA